jgi:hypothetical protein
MNEHSDIERVLTTWFDDGPSRMPDRVVDVVADRIGRQSQRRAWRLDRRPIRMTTTLKLATAAVAVAIVAIVGYNLLPGSSSNIGGPAPSTPGPSASVEPTPSSSPRGFKCRNDGSNCPSPLAAGPHSSKVFAPTITFTAPAGYIEFGDEVQTYNVRTDLGAPPGGFAIFRDPGLATNANDCAGIPASGIAWTVAGISEALAKDPRFTVTTATPATIGSYTGVTFDIAISPSWTDTCPWSQGAPEATLLTVRQNLDLSSPRWGLSMLDPTYRVFLFDAGTSLIWLWTKVSTADATMPVLQTISFAD